MEKPTSFTFVGHLTAEQPLATCSKDLKDWAAAQPGASEATPVPFTETKNGRRLMFPATGLRGRLRRAALSFIRDRVISLTGNETPFSLDEHYLLTLGGVKGKGVSERASVAHEAEWREKNPLLSMFGAGDAGFLGFVQGRLSVGNAICENAHVPATFSGARTDDLYRDKSKIAFLSDADVQSLIRQAQGNKERINLETDIKKLKANLRNARKAGDDQAVKDITAQIEAMETQVKEVLDNSGGKEVSIGRPLAGFQAIPQGETMEHRMSLMRSNKTELGLLIAGLAQLATEPFIGAHFATGCGMISGQWEVFEVSLGGKKSLGTVSFKPFDTIEIEGEFLTEAFHGFLSFMDRKEWNFGVPVLA